MELYEIRLYDHSGTLISSLRRWNRFEFHQRVSSPWNHQLTFEINEQDEMVDVLRDIKKDYFILGIGTDALTGERNKVYEGFNQTIVDQMTKEGNLIFNLYGVGYTELIKRRIVLPPYGQETSNKIGYSEDVMKGFVYDSLVNAVDITRNFPDVTIGPSLSAGAYEDYSARYTYLNTIVDNLAESGGLDYGIEGTDPPGQFVFHARTLWGEDRRFNNTAGNTPIIFDPRLHNMSIPIFSSNASEEKNYAYIGGEGEGINRLIQTASDPAAIAESPWGRKEAFVDARRAGTVAELLTEGQAYLEENKATEKFTFNVRQTDPQRWPRDWRLGDIITARYYNRIFDRKIVEIRVVVSAQGGADQSELVEAEMENV